MHIEGLLSIVPFSYVLPAASSIRTFKNWLRYNNYSLSCRHLNIFICKLQCYFNIIFQFFHLDKQENSALILNIFPPLVPAGWQMQSMSRVSSVGIPKEIFTRRQVSSEPLCFFSSGFGDNNALDSSAAAHRSLRGCRNYIYILWDCHLNFISYFNLLSLANSCFFLPRQ